MKTSLLKIKAFSAGLFAMTVMVFTLSACGGGASEKSETEATTEEVSEHPGGEHPSATTEEEVVEADSTTADAEMDSTAMDELDYPSDSEEMPETEETEEED
jgi:hypothetical protein